MSKNRVIRFMSANEAIKLLQGQRLRNTTDHGASGWFSSNSIGFCFALTTKNNDAKAICQWAERLSGIACQNVCLIGKLKPGLGYQRTKARYRSGMETELTTTAYELDHFDDWSMYTPELMPGVQILVPTSLNWIQPVPLLCKSNNIMPRKDAIITEAQHE